MNFFAHTHTHEVISKLSIFNIFFKEFIKSNRQINYYNFHFYVNMRFTYRLELVPETIKINVNMLLNRRRINR